MKGYEFTPPKPPKYGSIFDVIRIAKENYCWIFNKESRRWWTPDEFYDEFHHKEMSVAMTNFLEDISIRDPRSGISAAFKQVGELEQKHKQETQKLINRIEVFNKKVITYYQEMGKPRLRK